MVWITYLARGKHPTSADPYDGRLIFWFPWWATTAQDFVNLEEGGSERVWVQGGVEIGCGTGDRSGSGTRGSGWVFVSGH